LIKSKCFTLIDPETSWEQGQTKEMI